MKGSVECTEGNISKAITFNLKPTGYLLNVINPSKSIFLNANDVPDYVTEAIPFFFTFFLMEQCLAIYRKKPLARINDSIVSASHGVLFMLGKVFSLGTFCTVYLHIYNKWRFVTFTQESLLVWWISLIATDFVYYWSHRASHEISIIWAAHQLHHNSEDYNLLTSLRLSFLHGFFHLACFWVLAFFIPLPLCLVHFQLNLFFQFWIHTQVIEKLGPLEYIFNTPSHHRVHHGRNRYCIDKNYGALLIIWDRIFGTFEEEKEKIVYGLTQNVATFQLLSHLLDPYLEIFQKFQKMQGLGNKLSVLFKGPGWAPGKPRLGCTENIPDVHFPVKKFDIPIPLWISIYTVFQASVMVLFHIKTMNILKWIPPSLVYCFTLYEVFTVLMFGALFDKRWRKAVLLEILRFKMFLFLEICILPYANLRPCETSTTQTLMLMMKIMQVHSAVTWEFVGIKLLLSDIAYVKKDRNLLLNVEKKMLSVILKLKFF